MRKVLEAAFILAGIMLASAPAAALTITNCGTVISSMVRTETTPFEIRGNLKEYALPGANAIVTVPAGVSRCIKVRFAANLPASGGTNVRAMAGSVPLNPDALLFEKQPGYSAFEWGSRLGPGSYIVVVRVQTPTSINTSVGPWSMVIEVTN